MIQNYLNKATNHCYLNNGICLPTTTKQKSI